MNIFYNVLDLEGINASVTYQELIGKNISRQNFLVQLAEELRELHLNRKTSSKNPVEIRSPRINLQRKDVSAR